MAITDMVVGVRLVRPQRMHGAQHRLGPQCVMSKTCRRLLIVVGVLYELALALYLIGSRGWLGSSQGPLAGVFLIPLGLPWNWWLDGLPPDLWPLAAVCTPALNVLLLWGLCRWRSRR